MDGFTFPWNLLVKNQQNFEKLNTETYIITGILLVISVLLAYLLVTYLIHNQPSNIDFTHRKVVATAIGLTGITFLILYNWLVVSSYIKVPMMYTKFMALTSFGTVWKCVVAFTLIYVVILFTLAKIMPNAPINTVFAKRKK